MTGAARSALCFSTGGDTLNSVACRQPLRERQVAVVKILIVDDSKLVRTSLRKKLAELSFDDVSEASSVAEAKDALADSEVILTDFEMPGETGADLLSHVRAQDSGDKVAVLLVTAKDLDESERGEMAELGFDGVVDKGINPTQLREVVEDAWRRRCAPRERFTKGFVHKHQPKPIELAGFNNLTKCLSFNLYDFAIARNETQRQEYVRSIDEKYSAERIAEISRGICNIIEAEVLDLSLQDYDPHGASTLVLMSDIKGGGGPDGSAVHAHLNKSHICAHTYPDAMAPNGVCTFRVDIDIATCGEITPLKALNFMFRSFEADVVVMDYVVRGYTRDRNGRKVYIDHNFNSIRDFIDADILEQYQQREDLNIPPANTWQTKLMPLDLKVEDYFVDEADIDCAEAEQLIAQVRKEMREIYYNIQW